MVLSKELWQWQKELHNQARLPSELETELEVIDPLVMERAQQK
jgi:hypothetical protein|tara:strand:+ start:671 stop:799 length:129 start_codon:yes stop_codon:yes gene_type:complete